MWGEEMTIGERIKSFRKSQNKLTQERFGAAVGLKPNTITMYETNRLDPSDRTIADICRVYHIRAEWLRHGTGEMLEKQTPDQMLDELLADIHSADNATLRKIMRAYVRLSAEQRDAIDQLINNLLDAQREEEAAAAQPEPPVLIAAYGGLSEHPDTTDLDDIATFEAAKAARKQKKPDHSGPGKD